MVGGMSIEETGPLEATIKNLQREIDTKGRESGEMQRRWIAAQVRTASCCIAWRLLGWALCVRQVHGTVQDPSGM